MLCLSYFFARTRERGKNMATTDTQIHMVIVKIVKKQPYKITKQNIKRLVIFAKVFYFKTLPHKYLCHSIVRHFVPVI